MPRPARASARSATRSGYKPSPPVTERQPATGDRRTTTDDRNIHRKVRKVRKGAIRLQVGRLHVRKLPCLLPPAYCLLRTADCVVLGSRFSVLGSAVPRFRGSAVLGSAAPRFCRIFTMLQSRAEPIAIALDTMLYCPRIMQFYVHQKRAQPRSRRPIAVPTGGKQCNSP